MTQRRVLVTGSSRGLGLEFVRQYLAIGYEVIATCRDPANATALRDVKGDLHVAKLDVRSERDLDQLDESLGGRTLDLLICNAAVFGGMRARFENIDWESWRSALDVNLIGTLRIAMRLSRNVAASEERKIVFLSSRAGLPREARAHMSYIYVSTKAALNATARCFALDLRERGVTAFLLNPGHVKTGIGGASAPLNADESVSMMRRVIVEARPEHAARFWHFDGSELPL